MPESAYARRPLSICQIAATLNAEGAPAKRGGRWHPTTIARVLGRGASLLLPGRAVCLPLGPGTVDAVACRESAKGKR